MPCAQAVNRRFAAYNDAGDVNGDYYEDKHYLC